MRTNKQRKYAVILVHRWGLGKSLIGVIISTSVLAAHRVVSKRIQEATAYSKIKIKRADNITIRPWLKIGVGTRKALLDNGVRF